jgi:hypothetical protein
VAPGGDELVVEVRLVGPPGIRFERWDAVVDVRDPAGRVRVDGLDGPHEIDWPAGAAEVRIDGGGLVRPDGARGALMVRAAPR